MTTTAIVFNGTKIYLDTDMELHVIRGDLHIDTKSFKPAPKVRTMNGGSGKRTNDSIIGTIRNANLKVGKSMEMTGKRPSIAWAVRRLDMKAKIQPGRKEGTFQITRTV